MSSQQLSSQLSCCGVSHATRRVACNPALYSRPVMARWKFAVNALATLVFLFSMIGTTQADTLSLFGNPLFNPTYPRYVYDGGQISLLEADELAILNIRQVSELLNYDIRLFQPDLVTDGQPIQISMLGSGDQRIKAVWRGRPLRDPRTGHPDLNRLSHLWISGLRSVHSGALSGVSSAHGTVEIRQVDLVKSEPYTALHHRNGYYTFQPISFVHARRLTPDTDLLAGGFFPNSAGRFANAIHDGTNLFAEIKKYLSNDRVLSVGHQMRNDKVLFAFTEDSRSIRDNDFDISLRQDFPSGTTAHMFGYHLERAEREGNFRAHSRDWGGGIRTQNESIGFYGRLGLLDIVMPSTEKIRILEFESSVTARRNLSGFQLWGLVGLSGWLPDRTGLNVVVTADRDLYKLGRLGLNISRHSDPLTPEILYADYKQDRPSKILNSVWSGNPDLPIRGRILPKSTTENFELHWSQAWREYQIQAAVFQKTIMNAVRWTNSDSTIIPQSLDRHRTRGWLTELSWLSAPLRGNVSMIAIFRNEEYTGGAPIVMAEPPFRLAAEAGWHQTYLDGAFEADISISGQYMDPYYIRVANEWAELGAAYPLHFRMSGRIRSFTLYYGVHNWNSYQYYTVPGYRMMHKEEYWGIHWLLMN